jgi:hypothetical protein
LICHGGTPKDVNLLGVIRIAQRCHNPAQGEILAI